MNLQTENKLITCLIPKGAGVATISALKEELQVNCANVYGARSNLFQPGSKETESESETLTVVVAEARAEEVFNFLYEKLEIGTPNHGIIFQTPLSLSTEFTLNG
ncbi:MAG: hypothetical protein HN842_04400 [Gammaproteobacteria bacterium]|jgi:hypothetical protein|nr:hypothetical protein [Gammaproteobacteria bacterium]MBT7307433.1 hypothetical protein [Gammaproteobacteria bacterium]